MRPTALLVATLIIVPAVSAAQASSALTANAKVQFGALTGLVIRSAEEVPEDLVLLFRDTHTCDHSESGHLHAAEGHRAAVERVAEASALSSGAAVNG